MGRQLPGHGRVGHGSERRDPGREWLVRAQEVMGRRGWGRGSWGWGFLWGGFMGGNYREWRTSERGGGAWCQCVVQQGELQGVRENFEVETAEGA